MKIRKDYVTNSSSANYVLAFKSGKPKELNQKQKEAICEYVSRMILNGDILEGEELEDRIYGPHTDEIMAASEAGKEIMVRRVSFECAEDSVEEIYKDLIRIIEQNSDGDIEILDADLDY